MKAQGELKKVECKPDCGFLARSHDEKELVEIAIKHGAQFHGMKLTEKDVREFITAA